MKGCTMKIVRGCLLLFMFVGCVQIEGSDFGNGQSLRSSIDLSRGAGAGAGAGQNRLHSLKQRQAQKVQPSRFREDMNLDAQSSSQFLSDFNVLNSFPRNPQANNVQGSYRNYLQQDELSNFLQPFIGIINFYLRDQEVSDEMLKIEILNESMILQQRYQMRHDELVRIFTMLKSQYRQEPTVVNALNKVQKIIQLDTQAAQNIAAQADQLIEQCYFSPSMQYAMLSYMGRPFEVNIKSGKVNNLPTVTEIIDFNAQEGNDQLQKNALQAALEAVRLAKFVAALDVAYANPEYLFFAPHWNTKFLMPAFDSELKQELDEYETAIKQNLPDEGFLMSWMPAVPQSIKNMFSINNNAQVPSMNRQQVVGAMYSNDKIISNATMESIIKNYDAFQKVTTDEIANLLFKQIFIAQQADQGDNPYLDFKSEISATNYLYDHISGVDGIIAKIQQKLQATRADMTKISQAKLQAHHDLLHVRKAVQTAIFIANKNSTLYLGFILPAVLTKHADSVVKKLMSYDEKLSRLCKDPNYGATKDDLERDTTISRITWIIGGLAFIGGLDFISGGKSSQIAGQVAQTGVEYAIVTPVKALGYGGVGAVKGVGNVGLGAVSGIGNVAVGTVKGVSDAAVDFKNWATSSNSSSKQPADKTN